MDWSVGTAMGARDGDWSSAGRRREHAGAGTPDRRPGDASVDGARRRECGEAGTPDRRPGDGTAMAGRRRE
uniref:Uncharacterized protein n=1 Tax=Arundo donax TaxID=35708 RepID=A0A0A9A769_ARUDO